MPQMAPMSWMMLFIMFSMSLMIMSTVNYYLYQPYTPKNNVDKKQSKMFNWKW